MRYQQGSTPNPGSQQTRQPQMNQGDEGQKAWPFKPFEYPPETGQPEFTLESLKEDERRGPRKQKGAGKQSRQSG